MKIPLKFIVILCAGIGLWSCLVQAQNQHHEYSVHSIKKIKAKKIVSIKLVYPPHRSTLTRGVITLEWSYVNSGIRRVIIEIFNLEKRKTVKLKVSGLRKNISLNAGRYQWRATQVTSKKWSTWRSFKVVNGKSDYRR